MPPLRERLAAKVSKMFSRQEIDVEAALIQLARHPGMYSKAQIHKALVERFGEDRAPSERTVSRLVDKARAGEPPQPWHWSDFSPEDARILLAVTDAFIESALAGENAPLLAQIIGKWPGLFQDAYMFDKHQAEWVVKVARVAPELDPLAVHLIATMYMLHEQKELPTHGIDTFLAMRPWRAPASAQRYLLALDNGHIPPMSVYGAPLIKAVIDTVESASVNQEKPPGDEKEEDGNGAA
jgi:hypothetical protein